MFGRQSSYEKLAKTLAPLALEGKIHYLPNFECCRNCAAHRIENTDWGTTRGVATFNEQTKEFADESGQLELTVSGAWEGDEREASRALAMLIIEVQLIEIGGYRKIEEGEQAAADCFLRTETGFLIWGSFRGSAKIDRSVRKSIDYRAGTISPLGGSGLIQIWPSDHQGLLAEEARRAAEVPADETGPVGKALEELLVPAELDSWRAIEKQIEASANRPWILSRSKERAPESLLRLQMSTQSYLGAVTYNTGGMLFADGFIRLYGSGSDVLPDIAELNGLTTPDQHPDMLAIGYDLVGRIYALDNGGLELSAASVCFLSVDTLEWKSLGMSYSEFLSWLIDGSQIESIYENVLWDGWREDTKRLQTAYGFHLAPVPSVTLWRDESMRNVRAMALTELISIHGMDVYSVER